MRLILKILFTFLPLLAFAKEKPIIILDPGHGGRDQGAKVRQYEEKKLTLRTSYLIKKHLEELGYSVVMTRARDIFLPLETRVTLANRRTTSLFVSIHYNSASSPSAKGIEVYYYGKGQQKRRASSKQLATSILKQMVVESDAESRGIKQGDFQVIRDTLMPAVLVEAGFITNKDERSLIGSKMYLEKLAKGIAHGVDLFVKSKAA